MSLDHDLAGARDATARLLAHLDAVPPRTLEQPSRLPRWSRSHVVAHLAGNVRSHVRMLDGCLAAEVRAQYEGGREARESAIDALAADPADAVEEHRSACAELAERWRRMALEHWERDVLRLDRGPEPAVGLAWARWREVELHRVDLDLGYEPADWEPGFARRLLEELLDRTGLQEVVRERVRGPDCAVAVWLSGRSDGSDLDVRGELPGTSALDVIGVTRRGSLGPSEQTEEQMPYTGEVVVDGPVDTRTAGCLQITKVATPPFENNCYLLRCTQTKDTLLVDAAGNAPRLLELVGDGRLVAIVETHGHWDHVQALAEVKEATEATVICHPADAADLPVPADRLVQDGDTIEVGACTLSVIALEGHTPGSIALLLDADGHPHLFSGDSLFPGGPGNTEKDPKRFTSLMDDLERKVFGPLPDETWVYPGHGLDTTLGAERPHLAEWRERGW